MNTEDQTDFYSSLTIQLLENGLNEQQTAEVIKNFKDEQRNYFDFLNLNTINNILALREKNEKEFTKQNEK
ncbi:hypothetical protein M0813_29337 [Anaeramoeba flamelloides]|uniref:Uncharacterized protein n=1 Tax=Anaeramoeba flamelloides TaxID=1746091 RepID=A0ABQ8XQR6_9EUKA|nr:hypothetical protein M0813_29337 [Anaeramoeba flamelloides]